MTSVPLRTAILIYGGVAATALGWAAFWGEVPWLFGREPATLRALLSGVLVGLGITVVCQVAHALVPAVQRASRLLATFFGPIRPREALLLAAISGVTEEMLFRGALWPQLGLPGTTILFGLLHVVPVRGLQGYPLFAALAGLVLGLLRQQTGSVWPCALAHATVNAINLAYLGAMERRRLAGDSFALPVIPDRAASPEAPLMSDAGPPEGFPMTVWRYRLTVELTGTDRESLPDCLEHENLALFAHLPREEVYAQLRAGRLQWTGSFDQPYAAFPEDAATLSTYLTQTVTGLEIAERYTDEKTTDDVRAWRLLAQRGEWVKVPLVVEENAPGKFVVDDSRYDVEVIAAHWREYPRWFQDGMRFRFPRLREL